jgi:hypothetical protein
LQTAVGSQVGVTTLPASTVAENTRLQAGATNLGVSQQQRSVFPDPQPGAPGGYGFNTGDSFGGTPIINADGMLGVAQSYLVTGNIRPGAQQTQAAVSDIWQRVDTDGGSAFLGNPVTDPVPYLSDTLRFSAFNAGASAIQNIDPLVLDLDGDGVELSSWIEKNIFFDTVGDGKLHQTGWVADKDGILALDLNGNGKIDDITETLSVHFNAGATPRNYADGIAALSALAQAGATVFSRATSRTNAATGHLYFDDLRVWIDANHDAKTDAGELKGLDQLGITSISLAGTGNHGEAIAGNDVMNRTSFTRSDGSTGQVASIDFQVEGASLSTTNLAGATAIKSEGAATVISYAVTDTVGHAINASTFKQCQRHAGLLARRRQRFAHPEGRRRQRRASHQCQYGAGQYRRRRRIRHRQGQRRQRRHAQPGDGACRGSAWRHRQRHLQRLRHDVECIPRRRRRQRHPDRRHRQ